MIRNVSAIEQLGELSCWWTRCLVVGSLWKDLLLSPQTLWLPFIRHVKPVGASCCLAQFEGRDTRGRHSDDARHTETTRLADHLRFIIFHWLHKESYWYLVALLLRLLTLSLGKGRCCSEMFLLISSSTLWRRRPWPCSPRVLVGCHTTSCLHSDFSCLRTWNRFLKMNVANSLVKTRS